MSKPKEYRFTAKLNVGDGGGAYIDFPYDVKKEFGKARVPIKCTFDGEPYRGTLIKYGTPNHILIVLKAIREKIGKGPGDKVDVWLMEDTAERKVEMPPAFTTLLKKHKLLDKFNKLSYTHQKEYVLWINSAKQEETRKRRMEKAIEMIRSKTD